MKKQLISVVVPTYNRKEGIKKCIMSLFKQDYPVYEVIVVDDGSTDGTQEMLEQLKKQYKFRYFRQRNKGPAAARNLGVKKAKGDLIAFTDDDCILYKDWLSELKKKLINKKIVLVGGASTLTRDDSLICKWQIAQKKKHGERFESNNFLILKKAFEEVRGFDTNFAYPGSEDAEMLLRLRLKGYSFERNPKALISHHHRTTFKALLKKAYHYGHGDIIYMINHPDKKLKQSHYFFTIPFLSVRNAFEQSKFALPIYIVPFAILNFLNFVMLYYGRLRQAIRSKRLDLLKYNPDHRLIVEKN